MTPELDKYRRDLLSVFERTEELLYGPQPGGTVRAAEVEALSGHAKDVLLGLGMIWSNQTNTYMFDQVEHAGHLFYAEPLPPYDVSAGAGNLAIYFPPECNGYKCVTCGLMVGVIGPMEKADRIYVGWGSFPPDMWSHPANRCKEAT